MSEAVSDSYEQTPEQQSWQEVLESLKVKNQYWQDDAKCLEVDDAEIESHFFVEGAGTTIKDPRNAIARFCMQCTVREDCLKDSVVRDDQSTIRGGMVKSQREKLVKEYRRAKRDQKKELAKTGAGKKLAKVIPIRGGSKEEDYNKNRVRSLVVTPEERGASRIIREALEMGMTSAPELLETLTYSGITPDEAQHVLRNYVAQNSDLQPGYGGIKLSSAAEQ